MFCSNCGSQQPAGTEVCGQCGQRMVPVSTPGPPPPEPASAGRLVLKLLLFVVLLALAAVAGYHWRPPVQPGPAVAKVTPSEETVEPENDQPPETSKTEETTKTEPADTTPSEGDSADLGGDPKTVLNGFLTAYFGGQYEQAQRYLTGKAAAEYKADADRAGTEYLGFEIKEGPIIINENAEFRVMLRWTFTGMAPKESMERYTLQKTADGWRIASMPSFP